MELMGPITVYHLTLNIKSSKKGRMREEDDLTKDS
jgi:hypothetical protein